MGTPLSREDILSAVSFRSSKLVEVAGHTFRIVGLSSAELARGREGAQEENPVASGRRRILEFVRCGIVDDNRRPIFDSIEDVEAFEDKFEQPAFLALANAIADMTHGEVAGEGKAPNNGSSPVPSSSTPTT
jgi:hypothetical protein